MGSFITDSWLMWVGAEHYPTSEDYSKEAEGRGNCKRVPNLGVANSLTKPGSVVFVAHDDGKYSDCEACMAPVDCDICSGSGEVDTDEGKAPCDDCAGLGKVELSTGGTVKVDGKSIPYRKHLAQAKGRSWKKEDHTVEDKCKCEVCGGTGRMPQGFVFGLFIPQGIEYILKPEDDKRFQEKLKRNNVKITHWKELDGELPRGCGERKAGGYYVITDTTPSSVEAQKTVDELVADGLLDPGAIEVTGNFIKFLNKVPINHKRFRGVARFDMNSMVKDEAEMILDALETA